MMARVYALSKSEVIIFCIAFFVRVLFFGIAFFALPILLDIVDAPIPLVGSDSRDYLSDTQKLLETGKFLDPLNRPNSFEVPGYPLFLAAIKIIFGNIIVAPILQSILVAFAAVFMFRVGRLFSRRVAWGAALLTALDPISIFYSNTILTEPLFIFFLAVTLWLMTKIYSSWWTALYTGFFLGAATMVRPVGEMLLPAIIFFYLLGAGWKNIRRGIVMSLLALVGFFIVVGPWLLRNHILFDRWELSAVASYNYVRMHAPVFYAYKNNIEPRQAVMIFRERLLAIDPRPEEVLTDKYGTLFHAPYMWQVALSYITQYPEEYAIFHLIKTIPFFLSDGLREVAQRLTLIPSAAPNIGDMVLRGDIAALRGAFRYTYIFVLFFAGSLFWIFITIGMVAGCIIAIFRESSYRRALLVTCFLFVITMAGVAGGALAHSRFRLSVSPFMFLLASYGISDMLRIFKKMSHRYYHSRFEQTLHFIIPPHKKVLFLGSFNGSALASLQPSRGIGIEHEVYYVNKAKTAYPHLDFFCKPYNDYQPNEQFDFIVLNGALGKSNDLVGVLTHMRRACNPSTRLVVYQHNHLWQGILSLAEMVRLKRKEGIHNWLSVHDLAMYLAGSGFEVTRIFRKTISPIRLFGIGHLFNWLFVFLPLLDFFKLDQYIIARPLPELFGPENLPKSVTICLTVRNERDNIESIVTTLPRLCDDQEILFVEGHSTDGTREEIERFITMYPEKNIRVIGQPGKGQGDAIRVGFRDAKGDVIILYEGDGTSDVGDLYYFWEAMARGRFEFIEGSRFVYPIDQKAMPLANKIGNIFFARWFSFFLGQRVTDVLSGIKAILKKDYLLLDEQWGFLRTPDPFGDFELLYGAARMGLKFGEIPMRYYPRPYGASKTHVFSHGLRLLRMAWRGYLTFRRN